MTAGEDDRMITYPTIQSNTTKKPTGREGALHLMNLIIDRVGTVEGFSSGFLGECPTCAKSSLFIRFGNHRNVVVSCTRGCAIEGIALALGMRPADIGA